MKGLKGLLIGLSAAPAFLAVEGGPAGAGGEIITQPSCFRLKNCTFGPKSIVYVPSYPLYATPQQCASPASVSTTATSVLNRGEFTLSTSSKVPLLFASIPYAESASMKQGTTTQWNLQATLDQYTANHAVAPGLLNVDAAYYACENPHQVHSPAPLQCTLKSCVAFPDTWPPKSLAVCPSYLSANTVTYGDMTFYTHLKDPFKEQDMWGKVLDEFVQWSDHVSNFPCVVSDVAQSRCDSFTVLSKSLGRRAVLDLVGGSGSNKLTVLRHLGTPTESELVELKAIAQKMDLTLDAPIPDAAAVCTK
ncbi:hypothetical protein DYB37_007773 [Aphanomyces astaci]|uniref:Uncharacterized protein n=1 Tax=Aphanomyces astaci TaxID=112090 RepID=A0A3R7BNV5_APHAT|nr:hypothetical protein DYB37_007773 [Aphanomyces astaci]